MHAYTRAIFCRPATSLGAALSLSKGRCFLPFRFESQPKAIVTEPVLA
jgi:hypothetical protein